MEVEDKFQEHGIVKIIFRDDDHDEILNENYENDSSKNKKVWKEPVKKSYQCKFCQKIFKHHPSLARHVKIHHSKIKAKKVIRSCNNCGKVFLTARDLKKHVDIHHLGQAEKYKQKCHICLKSVQQLKTHIRFIHKGQQHLSEYNGRCPQCFKTFSNDYGVKRHIKAVHLQVKPWECGECGKRFNDKKDLVRHHRGVHLGERVNTWNNRDGGHNKNSRNGDGLNPKQNNLEQATLTKSDGFATSETGTEVQELPRDVLAQELVTDHNIILGSRIVDDLDDSNNEENSDLKDQSSHDSINVIYEEIDGVENDGQSNSVFSNKKSKKSQILQVEENRFQLVEERIDENGDVVLEIQEIDQESQSTKTSKEEKLEDKNYVTLTWPSNSTKENAKNLKSKLKKIYPDGLIGTKKKIIDKQTNMKRPENETLDINLKMSDIIRDPDSDLEEELTEEDFSAVGSMLHEGSEIDILPMLSKGSVETAFNHRASQEEKISLQESNDRVSKDLIIGQKIDNYQNETPKTDVRSRRIAYRCGACGKMFVGEEFLKTHIERIHLKGARDPKEGVSNNREYDKSIGDENEDEMEEDFGDLEVFFRKEEADNVKQNKEIKQPLNILKEGNSIEGKKVKPDELENIICNTDGCQKSFSGRSRKILYKRHVERVHLKLKEEVCPKCNKGFYENRDLIRHIESHHENIRTVCPVESCGKLVARLDQHVRIMHSENSKSIKDVFECPECGKVFGRSYDLTRHKESVHLKIKNFVCPICNKGFTDKRDLNRHAQAIHLGVKRGQKNFSCCVCGFTFRRKKDLDSHRMSHIEEEEEFEMEQGVNYLGVNPNKSTIYVSNEGDTVVETETEVIQVHEMETNITVVETNGKVHMLKQGEDGLVVLPKIVEYVTSESQYVIE